MPILFCGVKNSCSKSMIFVSFSIDKYKITFSYSAPFLTQLTSCTPTKSNLYLANPLAVRPGRDADPSPPSSAKVKNRVELYIYSP